MSSLSESFLRLITIMDELREKCPWDRKQTIRTLRHMTIEETYELADAISGEDWKGIREELGDLLLHVVFYARIGREQNQFTLEEVINGICDKLIARHPHIYGDVKVNDEEDVKKNWEKLKIKEGKKSVLSGVPQSLPSIVKAMRLQEKAKQVGFEWENKEQVWEKVEEEMKELQAAISNRESLVPGQSVSILSEETGVNSPESVVGSSESELLKNKIEEELGDVIFSLVNYARFLQVDADHALEVTNKKFTRRFQLMEEQVAQTGKELSAMSLAEMDAIWNSIKKQPW